MDGNKIVAYRYEGILHCIQCARKRFGKRLNLSNTLDREGNNLQPIFAFSDEANGMFCDECAEPLMES